MKKRYISVILIIGIILYMLIPITNVLGADTNENNFIEVNKTELTKNDILELSIKLDKIKFEYFTFELVSDTNIEDIIIEDNLLEEVEKQKNEINIQINKLETNLSEIKLNYVIPEDVNIGDKINLVATIINNNAIEEKEEVNIQITIIEQIDEPENNSEDEKLQNENPVTTEKEEEKSNSNANIPNLQNTEKTNVIERTGTQQNNMSNTSREVITYNGSDNNYLSDLYINGYTLNREFQKDNTTYFLTVENDVDSIEVIANKEDEKATVNIYGNENLKQGNNKILIYVTAENGNVRTYRIYVTKNA